MTKLWYPDAVRQPLDGSGAYSGGKPKLLWHTTEGATYPGTSLYHGTQPHFTCDFKKRKTYQHIDLNHAACALMHPSGTGETNHDNVVQVELVGFSAQSGHWTKADYAYIAKLARFIEHERGVPRQAGVSFSHPQRFTWGAWHNYSGHCGHVHAPYNDHSDPGVGFRIDLVLARGSAPSPRPATSHPTVREGDKGETVHHLQSALRALGYHVDADARFGPKTGRAVKDFQARHHLDADGICGPATWAAIHKALKDRSKK